MPYRWSGTFAAALCTALALLTAPACNDKQASQPATQSSGVVKASPAEFVERAARIGTPEPVPATPSPSGDDATEVEDDPYIPPVRIVAEPETGGAPLTLNLSVDIDETISGIAYTWDFGDGTPRGHGRSVTHTFWHAGEYTVGITARGHNADDSDETTITVEEQAFDLDIQADPDVGSAPLHVQFDAVIDEDLPGPLSFQWDFGDGSRDMQRETNHTYRNAGEYVAVLTVTNPQGQWAQRDIHIQVDPPDPN
ncbi:MAG: PKD domain-containing protein [Deltaproteobacteria bacterium]|nr:PKD domain-containing protein [Deltaproteobacteria bacterium]